MAYLLDRYTTIATTFEVALDDREIDADSLVGIISGTRLSL
jgi:hypothetical protein